MASLGNMYPNLPGMLVEFKDGGQSLKFDQTESNTDSMLILGTAIDGPVMEPVAVDDNTAELLFGSELKANGAPNGSTLMRAYKEARDNGCQDIRLMRVTGSQADAVISAPSEDIETVIRVDETIGAVKGNDETVLELAGKGIIEKSVVVTAKGKRVDSKYVTVDTVNSTVTLAEDACDAGASLTVRYDYEIEEQVKETLVLSANRELYLNDIPVHGSVTIKKKNGGNIDPSEFTVVNGKITLTEDGAAVASIELNSKKETLYLDGKKKHSGKVSRAIGDEYEVEYKVLRSGIEVEIEDKNKNAFFAETKEQKVMLSGAPRSTDELSLYVDDTLVLDTYTYSVDLTDNSVSLKKEFFQLGESISVSYFASKTETVDKTIKISSIFGGELYNESKIEVIDYRDASNSTPVKAVKLTKPSSKLASGEEPLIFITTAFETFGELVEAINTYSGIFQAETNTPDVLTEELVINQTYFRNGDDGVNVTKEEMFVALSGKRDKNGYLEKQGAYQLLENYQCDWVVPVGVYADDTLLDRNKDFAYELALFCAVNSFRNKAMYGAIPMKPLQNTSLASVQAHAKYLANFTNQYFMKDSKGSVILDGQNNPIDLGKFISIIAGPTVTVNHSVLSLKDGNGAVAYVAYNTTLLPHSAPTNKRLTGTNGVKYNFSNAQLNDIAGNRLVCFGKKFSSRGEVLQGAYIIDGPTCARVGSEYGRLSTLKVMREVTDQIREVSDPFIGEANTIEQRNSLSAAISKRLDTLVSIGVLLDYSFNLVATQQDQVLGQCSLELGIVAPQELRKITTVIGLKR